MYDVLWDEETGGIVLSQSKGAGLRSEVRPVYAEELNLLGFDRYWQYDKKEGQGPLLWSILGRRYYYKGRLVAEADGGGLYELPQIKVFEEGLLLEPVKIASMLAKSEILLEGLVQKAQSFIEKSYRRYRNRVDIAAVAFSGGKDSIVTLDLVQKTLAPDEYVAVFGDTTMEVSATYNALDRAKERWPSVKFETARSDKDATTTWQEMGPPSRILRWCCSVHKTVPTLLLLRKLCGKVTVKALVFDGVRHDESAARSKRESITEGGKHKLQTNISPIIEWSAAEVYLYLISRDLLFNDAYRYGARRVGCGICPAAAEWGDSIAWSVYQEDLLPFVSALQAYAEVAGVTEAERETYLREGGWKGRAGGRFLPQGGNRVSEKNAGKAIRFTLRYPEEDWLTWAETLGKVIRTGEGQGYIEHRNGLTYTYSISKSERSVDVLLSGLDINDRLLMSHVRATTTKAAYCLHCRACEVECPTGALSTWPVVSIDSSKCVQCGRCLELGGKICQAARSLTNSEGGASMNGDKPKGLPSYQHFGIRKSWLEEYLVAPDSWAAGNGLGNRQFEAMRGWLKHSEIVSGDRKGSADITPLANELARLGANNPITWAIVWANLARNSALISWYIKWVPWGLTFTKSELIDRMADQYPNLSRSSRENSASALWELLTKSPLGSEYGLGREVASNSRNVSLYKTGWREAEPLVVLYSLYRYAEKTSRYNLTVGELYNDAVEGPYAQFGIDKDQLKRILQGLSVQRPGWIQADIIRDLDNITLDQTRTALEVLTLA